MEFKDIRLIGVDLDGTLLTDDKELTPELKNKIIDLCQKGIHFVPITGRPLTGIPDCLNEIEELEYVITSNGSQITHFKTGTPLFSFPISNSKANEIISILEGRDCMYEVFADGVGYIKQDEFEFHKSRFDGTPFGEYLFKSRKVVPSILELFLGTQKDADEVFILCNSQADRDELVEIFKGINGIQLCIIADKFLEITKENTNKGNALAVLCDYFGISLSQTIAFGDGENDLQFLERAGISVAMENAVDEVKKKADFVTKSNNENGVLEVLKCIS